MKKLVQMIPVSLVLALGLSTSALAQAVAVHTPAVFTFNQDLVVCVASNIGPTPINYTLTQRDVNGTPVDTDIGTIPPQQTIFSGVISNGGRRRCSFRLSNGANVRAAMELSPQQGNTSILIRAE